MIDAFRSFRVGMLERRVVCSYTNEQSMQIVKKLKQIHVQFVSRTKDIGRIRLTSSTTQTCVLKSIMVFFEVAYTGPKKLRHDS